MGVVLALDSNMVDFPSYMSHYEKTPALIDVVNDFNLLVVVYGEPLFVGFQVLCKSIGLNYIGFRILFFSLMMLLNTLLFYKFKPYIFFILLWYLAFFYHNDGNIMRSAFSSTLVMLSVVYLNQKNLMLSFFCFVLAVLMHYFALFLLFFYTWYFLNFKRKAVIFFLLFSFLLGLLGISKFILLFIVGLGGEDMLILDKIYRYSLDEGRQGAGVLRFITVLPILIISVAIIKYRIVIRSKSDNAWLMVFTIAVSSLFFFSDFRLMSDRLFTLLGFSGSVLLILTFRAFDKSTLVVYQFFWISLLVLFTGFKYRNYTFGGGG